MGEKDIHWEDSRYLVFKRKLHFSKIVLDDQIKTEVELDLDQLQRWNLLRGNENKIYLSSLLLYNAPFSKLFCFLNNERMIPVKLVWNWIRGSKMTSSLRKGGEYAETCIDWKSVHFLQEGFPELEFGANNPGEFKLNRFFFVVYYWDMIWDKSCMWEKDVHVHTDVVSEI